MAAGMSHQAKRMEYLFQLDTSPSQLDRMPFTAALPYVPKIWFRYGMVTLPRREDLPRQHHNNGRGREPRREKDSFLCHDRSASLAILLLETRKRREPRVVFRLAKGAVFVALLVVCGGHSLWYGTIQISLLVIMFRHAAGSGAVFLIALLVYCVT